MRSLSWIVIPLLLVTASSYASNSGILITPDKAGEFEYVEDFTTPGSFIMRSLIMSAPTAGRHCYVFGLLRASGSLQRRPASC